MVLDCTLFALYRVNRITGKTVRFERGSFPAGPKATIEGLAAGARCSMVGGDADWEISVLRDVRAELEIEGVPEPIVAIVEELTKGREWGLCDPMYMANRVAVKFGWGDGRSNFASDLGRPADEIVNEFANEIYASYCTSFGELGVTPGGVRSRVWNGLLAEQILAAAVDRPRG